jgi:hypothetical protein
MPPFIPGLQLSELFYQEAVRPLLDRSFPGIAHTAALIGYGSDVIGFDTAQSTDHMWGPRLVLFLPETGFDQQRQQVDAVLRSELPVTFRGYSTHFGSPDEIGVRLMKSIQTGPVDHLVEIVTLPAYIQSYLGFDPGSEIELLDWLTFSEHRLLAVTSGKVFHDELGLNELRRKLSYYPHELWLYLLAAQWAKIGQEEPFVGRTGDVGDELGSQVIAGRLVHALMQLSFLMERCYAPYSKWFGSAFSRLPVAAELGPLLRRVLLAVDWREREGYLVQAYQLVARKHNILGITSAVSEKASWFHERPYLVIHADEFANNIQNAIKDEQVRVLPPFRGSVNQLIELTDVVEDIALCRHMRSVWQCGA